MHSSIAHQGARLRDDASMHYLQWDGTPDVPITGRMPQSLSGGSG